MANLSITNTCNKRCSYCFASDSRIEYANAHMSEDTYRRALDYLQRSGLRQARLLGGEPTLHPRFIQFVEHALERELDIMLFTNGLIANRTLDFLDTLPRSRLSVLLNTIHPMEGNANGIQRQREVMRKLGDRVIAGVNVYSGAQELSFLLTYINAYNLKREVRIGVSHPVLSQRNAYLHPKNYRRIGQKIAAFKAEAQGVGVALGFDCGFVPCMIPDEHFNLLSSELRKAGSCCHPIIDMLCDGTFISCYPLHHLKKVKLTDQLEAKDLLSEFERALAPYANTGIYPYCSSCPLFQGRCNGGCMSFRIQRYA